MLVPGGETGKFCVTLGGDHLLTNDSSVVYDIPTTAECVTSNAKILCKMDEPRSRRF